MYGMWASPLNESNNIGILAMIVLNGNKILIKIRVVDGFRNRDLAFYCVVLEQCNSVRVTLTSIKRHRAKVQTFSY